MILRAIRVEGWKCFVQPVEVGPFTNGINVIFAPNATGKSTLFEALLRGILDGHRVKGADVEKLQPWGRSLAPTVVAEIRHGDKEYRLTKRFLSAPIAKLERKEGERFIPLAEGDAADEQIRVLLTQNPPGRGLSRKENWGLAQVLWAPQSDLELPTLSTDLVTSIRESLGVQLAGAGPLEERIRNVYKELYTDKGQMKKTSRLVRLQEELDRAGQERQTALTSCQTFEELSRLVEDLRARRAQAKRDADEVTSTLAEVRKQSDIYRELSSQKRERQEQVKATEASYSELRRRIDTIQSVRGDLRTAQDSMENLHRDLPLLEKELKERKATESSAKTSLENIRKERESLDKAKAMAQASQDLVLAIERECHAKLLLGQVCQASIDCEEAKGKRAGLVAPDAKAMRSIRNLLKTRDDSQVRLDAALISLEIVPEKGISIEVISGEESGQRKLPPKHTTEIKGTPEVVVDISGVARLRARGPSESAEELRRERDDANRKLQALTSRYGTSDLDTLDALQEKADSYDKEVAQSKMRLDSLLDGKSIEQIQQEEAHARAEIEAILKQYPEWRDNTPDPKEMEKTADEIRKSFVEAIEPAEQAWEVAKEAFSALREKRAGIVATLTEEQKQVTLLSQRLQELTADGIEDAQRDKELGKAALAWDAAKSSLTDIQEKLSAYTSDPNEAIAKLERQLKALEDSATTALAEEKTAEGRLQHLVVEGCYSRLSLVDENIARLQREISREKLEAEAIKLLYTTVKSCRAEALAAVTGPVEAAVTQNLQRIAGPRFGHVKLGETFEPLHVIPQGTSSAALPEALSGGEREQLYFVTRLALSEVLAREERQLVVLDDTLIFTDAGRLARALSLLEEAAQHNQVIVLTCHPERYRGIAIASFIDLEAIVRGT